jgi:anaerobic magnesium-protoporphyrin IX monomethyl ester cyclase
MAGTMKIVFPYDGYEHLGVGYLAAVAMRHGHAIDLVPLNTGDFIRGHGRLSERGLRHSVSRVLAANPDVAAFSLNSFAADDSCRVASALRRQGVKTIAGGPHATAEPVITMQSGAFDGLVTGEAESVFVEALDYVVHEGEAPPGWLHTADQPVACSPPAADLDALPVPAKELFYRHTPFEADDYKILTSRGCPFKCIFCAHATPAGELPFRRRDIGGILGELSWAKRRFHPSTIYFLDDIFTLQREWLREFLREYRGAVDMPFHAISHPRYFTGDVAEMLRNAGCVKIRLGVQSLTPRIKHLLGRPEANEHIAQALSAAKRYGISVEVDHMVNLPGETVEEAREGVLFYNQHRPDAIKVYWLVPLPGTPWFSMAQRRGYLPAASADDIRRGRGFGKHSYLFYGRKRYSDRQWLGIHFLLNYLPFLPPQLVTFLVMVRADRFLRIPSFFVIVGISRLIGIIKGKDRVGETHLRRLQHHVLSNPLQKRLP